MRHPTYSSAPTIKERSVTAISLLLLVGLFTAAGGIMAYYFLQNPDLLFSNGTRAKPVAKRIHLKFEDGEFFIPSYMLNRVRRTTLRRVTQISLTIPYHWTPDIEPVSFNGSKSIDDWIIANIAKPNGKRISKSEWLSKIYRHYIAGPAIAHSSGLYRYTFNGDSPYGDIEIFTDDLQKPTLIISCDLRASSLGARLCKRSFKVSSRIETNYQFARSRLSSWQMIHQTMQKLIKTIYRRAGV